MAALASPDDEDVLVTGCRCGPPQEALLRLIAVEVVVGLVGLLAAAVVGFVIIRRTLQPLHRVAQTATRVSELQLSSGEVQMAERVPPADTDPHTEVGQVGSALNQLLDHVESSLAARQASETQVRQFVADASHELRTPIASIRGYAELMRRRDGEVPEDVGHAMRRVESEALRMSGLVDDLLLLARLDAGRDLAAGRRRPDRPARQRGQRRPRGIGPGHMWRVEQPGAAVTVPGDEARLHQVVANLLANIRTHTPEGTTATARLRAVTAGRRSRSRTTARASRRSCCRTCSSGSRGATRPGRGSPAAPGWGWRSSRRRHRARRSRHRHQRPRTDPVRRPPAGRRGDFRRRGRRHPSCG